MERFQEAYLTVLNSIVPLSRKITEVAYVTVSSPAFCLALYLTGVLFVASYSMLVTSVSKKSNVDQSELEIGGARLLDKLHE